MNDYEKVQIEINESVTSDNFKEHLRKNYHNSYEEYLDDTRHIDLDVYYEKNSIPLRKLIPKGMTIKEYFSKKQRLLREENISYVKFDKDGYQ
jgi:hypothetical protein